MNLSLVVPRGLHAERVTCIGALRAMCTSGKDKDLHGHKRLSSCKNHPSNRLFDNGKRSTNPNPKPGTYQ